MDDNEKLSRANRHHNRRNNNKILFFFIGLAIVFLVILFLLIAFGGESKKDKPDQKDPNPTTDVDDEGVNDSGNTGDNTDNNSDANDANESETTSPATSLEDYKIAAPDLDDNIIAVYSGNWPPIGTTQTGEHNTVYENNSDDRIEIKKAASMVLGIAEDNMTEYFVGNGGDNQTAIATIIEKSTENYYKIYLSWIDEQGWQVTKVEKIREYE